MFDVLAADIGWGTTLTIKTLIVLGLIPASRADPRLHVPAEDDEPHAEPARADGPRRVPRLVPARRRRHQVHAEGRHHAGGCRPACLRARAGGRRDVDVPRVRRDPGRPAPRRRTARRRRVLRAGRVEPQRRRRADGRMGEREQVRAARRAARRGAVDRLRAPPRARRGRRGRASRHDEPAGHRRVPAQRRDLRVRWHRAPADLHAVHRVRACSWSPPKPS